MYQHGHKVYINMEYAENGDLFTFLHSNTLTEPQIRSWITQILFAFRLVFQRIFLTAVHPATQTPVGYLKPFGTTVSGRVCIHYN